MNKHLLFAAFAIASATAATAQPTLTAATNNPVIGNIFIEHHADTTGKKPGPVGSAVTWNFSTLSEIAADTTRYISCAATAYCDSFPGANIVAYSSLGYMYGVTSTTGYKILGGYQDSKIMHYSQPQSAMAYPLTYNTIQKDTLVSSIPGAGVPVDLVRYDSIVADGYGTLKLPSGNYANVLRLHLRSMDILSIALPDTILADTTYSESYAWYTPGFHSPLLAMSFDSSSSGMLISGLSWYTKPGTVTVNTMTVPNAGIRVYPNPAARDIDIYYNSPASDQASITLKDLTGRTTISWNERLKSDDNHFHYTLPELPAGMYILTLQTGNNLISEKITINN